MVKENMNLITGSGDPIEKLLRHIDSLESIIAEQEKQIRIYEKLCDTLQKDNDELHTKYMYLMKLLDKYMK